MPSSFAFKLRGRLVPFLIVAGVLLLAPLSQPGLVVLGLGVFYGVLYDSVYHMSETRAATCETIAHSNNRHVALTMCMLLGAVGMVSVHNYPHGTAATYLVIVVVTLNDTFGYIAGKLFGVGSWNPFPVISPNKTFVGYVWGAAAGVLSGWVVLVASDLAFMSWWAVAPFGLVIAGNLGDLSGSYIKRMLDIKDFSTLLGEHGGVTDRFDALTMGFLLMGICLYAPGLF